MARGSRNNVLTVLGIENSNLFYRNVEHLSNLTEINSIVHHHSVNDKRFRGEGGADVVLVVVGHHIGCSDKTGHVATSLLGQVVVDFPEVGVLIAATPDSLVYIAWTTVIGCNCKSPVAIGVVELFEKLRCHFAGTVWVTTLVNE